MKTLKQRFSVYYNRTHGRFGTLWADRFKSVLVEGRGHPLKTMAAYIDLNPVRAGLVEDPKDYRFCGYAEAVAGSARAEDGLARVWAAHEGPAWRTRVSVTDVLRDHRASMGGRLVADAAIAGGRRAELLRRLREGKTELSRAEVLRCRVRYLTDGVVLGRREFVASLAADWGRRERFKRPVFPRPMSGCDWGDLVTLRRLRSEVFG